MGSYAFALAFQRHIGFGLLTAINSISTGIISNFRVLLSISTNLHGVAVSEKRRRRAEKAGSVCHHKVKVRFKLVGDAQEKARKQAIAQTVAQALKRLKPKI
jgi:hypothetical protein